jgi:hypothetical protein
VSAILSVVVRGATASLHYLGRRDKKPEVTADALAHVYREVLGTLAELSGVVFRVMYQTDPERPWPKAVLEELERKHAEIKDLANTSGHLLQVDALEALQFIANGEARQAGMQQFLEAIDAAHQVVSRQCRLAQQS